MLTNIVGPATQMVIGGTPATVTAGSNFLLTVTAEDAAGNVATSYSGSITLSLASNPGGSTLAGTLTATVVSGIATFSGLSLNKASAGYILEVTSGTLSVGTSNPISVTPGSPTQLLIAAQPLTSVAAGSPFGLTVDVDDSLGNVVTSFAGSLTVGLNSNPGGSTLGGLLTVTPASGIASFSNLALNKVGAGYTLLINSGTLSATSSSISVVPGAATQLLIESQPPHSGGRGEFWSVCRGRGRTGQHRNRLYGGYHRLNCRQSSFWHARWNAECSAVRRDRNF